jgi:hypothetical protein
MIQTAFGITLPFPEKIKEEYQLYEHSVMFYVSFEKIEPMLNEFIRQLEEPLFLVLELPLSQAEEEQIRQSDADPFHRKVCYLDGQTKEQINKIIQRYGELLLNDGMSQLAVASHVTKDEIYIQKYKIISIFCYEPSKYIDFLKKYGLTQTDALVTPWDTFTRETPGEVRSVEMNGISVYEVYDELVKMGMYEAKIVED